MTSDKRLIETLKNIKDYCDDKINCGVCKFNNKENECDLQLLIRELHHAPCEWNMEKIEKVVKG